MRDPNRLFKIYDVIYHYHSDNPDLRFMQLLNNFFRWHYQKYRTDGFYIEDDEFIKRFVEFQKETMTAHYD